MKALEIAQRFGDALDNDHFEMVEKLLRSDCTYSIEQETIIGSKTIVNSYKTNMEEGRKKFDFLEWGKAKVTQDSETKFWVHFEDKLGHKGIYHTYRCKQLVEVINNIIVSIAHFDYPEEKLALEQFKRRVALL